jgi:hypothetical protein
MVCVLQEDEKQNFASEGKNAIESKLIVFINNHLNSLSKI